MRRIIMAIVCCALVFGSAAPPLSSATARFPDMDHSWFRYSESVAFLVDRGVIQGYPDGTFHPKNPINRAEFLKLVFRAAGGHDPVGGSCFPDVPSDAWFAPFVCAAVRRDVVNGYPDGLFRPEQTVNTAEALKIIANLYDRKAEERTGEYWYRPYVKEFDRDDVFPEHSYLPGDLLNRERAADLIARVVRHEEQRITPRDSAGCGKVADGESTNVYVNGIQRSYLLTIPSSYNRRTPAPLVIAFHGRTNSNEEVRKYYGLDKNMRDAFIAYPAGMPVTTGGYSWSDPGNRPSELRDLALFDAIVEQLSERYCIDMDRIFVVGHSLGAWFANSVACMRGDVVRASATVGGSSVITDCTSPAAALIINNPKDTLSPHSGAEATRDMRLEENVCTDTARESEPRSFNCERYSSCSADNDVLWCPHTIDTTRSGTYYPHLWPDTAGKEIANFFGTFD